MTSHRAMKNLAENPEGIRALARSLLSLGFSAPVVPSPICARDSLPGTEAVRGTAGGIEWSDWEADFLESLVQRDSAEPLSIRQREKLVELRSAAERYTTFDGFNVRRLIERAFTERFDLDDETDQEFLAEMKASGAISVSRRQMLRLLRCWRALGLVEAYHGLES